MEKKRKSMFDYPYTICINVLLSDNKIVNWKVGREHWKTTMDAFMSRMPLFVHSQRLKCEVQSLCVEINSSEENRKAFGETADKFYRQWEIHPDFDLSKPYDKT